MNAAQNTAQSSSEPSVAQAFAFLRHGAGKIVLSVVVAAAIGVAYADHHGTTWRVKSVLYVEDGEKVVLGQSTTNGPDKPLNYAKSQSERLRATPVLEAALAQPGISGSPVFKDSKNELAWLKRKLDIAVGDQDNLIEVRLDSKFKEEACDVVNAVVDAYRKIHAEDRRESASVLLTRLTEELERFEGDLLTEQQSLVEFLRANPGIGLYRESRNSSAERLNELNLALTRAQLATFQARDLWTSASQLLQTPDLIGEIPLPSADSDSEIVVGGEGSTPVAPLDVPRLRELRGERERLLRDVTPGHPAVAEIDRAIDDFTGAWVDALERQYQVALKREEDLGRRVQAEEDKILAYDPKHAEFDAIEKRVARASGMSDLLYQRISEIDVNESLDDDESGSRALVYEYATPKSALVATSQKAIIAILTFLGMIFGVGFAWVGSLTDRRLRTPDDVATRWPLLTTVPKIEPGRDGIITTWTTTDLPEPMRSLDVYVEARRFGSVVLQITSAENREGKSLVTAGLGIAMAQAGKRTLILDADLKNPSQLDLFGVVDHARRSEFGTYRTAIENLELLSGTVLQRDSDEPFSRDQLTRLLKDQSRRFDRILIDSPALLSASNAKLLATASDETILVIRSGKTTDDLANAAVGALTSIDGRFAGVVLNGAPPDSLSGHSRSVSAPVATTETQPVGSREGTLLF